MNKAKRFILLGVALLIALVAVGLLVIVILHNKPSEVQNNNYLVEETTSLPVSYLAPVEISNDENHQIPPYTRTAKTNLYYDCGGDYKIAPVDITIYDYSEPVSYSSIYSNEKHFSAQVFRKMADFIKNDEVIKDGYESMNNVISSQSINSVQLTKLIDSYGLSCTGGRSLPILYSKPILSESTSNSFIVLSYGSNQSVINSSWVPVFIDIISVEDGNYTLYSTMVDYNELVKFNNLKECEELTEYGYPYIKIFPNSHSNNCVLDKFEKDMDDRKINEFVDKLLNLKISF